MLDPMLAAFLQGPVMMIVGLRDARGLPAVARAVGARVSAAGVDLFVPTRQWGPALDGLSPGDPIALTFVQPTDYRSYQLKGPVLDIGPATDADQAVSATYAAMMQRLLVELGVGADMAPHWLTAEALARVSFAPDAAFTQTPGPGAGAAVGASA